MAIKTSIWTVGKKPQRVPTSELSKEQLLEDMIVAEPAIIADDWMIIGRQVRTAHGGFIDLLGIRPDGTLLIVELKRGKTPRDIVAQGLDYASWVRTLEPEHIAEVYDHYSDGGSLAVAFQDRFGSPLGDEGLDGSHEIVLVASRLDASTERIVDYLSDSGVAINVMCFSVFQHGNESLLSRSWLLESPADAGRAASTGGAGEKKSEPWNGEYYCSFGDGVERSWTDAREYGFISAGGGDWYTRTLGMLSLGDRVWVKVPGAGFVGVAEVEGEAQSVKDFVVQTKDGDRPFLTQELHASYLQEYRDDPEMAEMVVPVKWLRTVSLKEAVNEVGLFGNQNTVCRPRAQRWRTTVGILKKRFGISD